MATRETVDIPSVPDSGVIKRATTIRSIDREAGTTASKPTIVVRDGGFGDQEQKSYVTFNNLCLYQTLPNVNGFTNQLKLSEAAGTGAGGNFYVTIDEKNYTAAQLATELETQLDAASPSTPQRTYTITYDSQTGKYSAEVSDGITSILGYQNNLNESATVYPTTMSRILGMTLLNRKTPAGDFYLPINFTSGGATEFPQPANLAAFNEVQLRLAGVTTGVDSNNTMRVNGKILSVKNTVDFGGKMEYVPGQGSMMLPVIQFYQKSLDFEWIIDFENGTGPHIWPATWMTEWSVEALQYQTLGKSEELAGTEVSHLARKRQRRFQ